MTDPGPGDEWLRLHPLTPVARIGRHRPGPRAAPRASRRPGPARTTAPSSPTTSSSSRSPRSVYGWVHWLVTRWRIEGDTLRIETGLIRKDSRRLPLARIQAVDIVRPLLARLLGLSELRIRLAGSGSTDGKLAYLSDAEAVELRVVLLAGHHDVAATATAPPPAPPPPCDRRATCAWRPCRGTAGRLRPLVPRQHDLVGTIAGLAILDQYRPRSAAAAAGFLAVYLLSVAGVVWRRLSGQYAFEAVEGPEGVRITRGLLQTISETIPYGRIQAVRQVRAAAVAALRVVPAGGRHRRGVGAERAWRGHGGGAQGAAPGGQRGRTRGTSSPGCWADPIRCARRRRPGPGSRPP